MVGVLPAGLIHATHGFQQKPWVAEREHGALWRHDSECVAATQQAPDHGGQRQLDTTAPSASQTADGGADQHKVESRTHAPVPSTDSSVSSALGSQQRRR